MLSDLALWECIRAQADDGGTVLLTTNYMEEAQALADDLTIIDHGKLVATGTPDELRATLGRQKRLCYGASFYVLGPLVTDIAPGYDHITSAIGGAIAAASGADFLCYVTPAEHLRLPDLQDMKEGIVAARIAAHAADIAKGYKGARDWDDQMSAARAALDWEKQFDLALDPVKPRQYRAASVPEHHDSCTMCGKMCAVRNMKRVKEGKDIQLAC